eukprot:scaffold1335_cov102-Isochrysis_galbana.AAC.1
MWAQLDDVKDVMQAYAADTRRGNNQYQSRPRTSTPCDHCGGAHRPPCVGSERRAAYLAISNFSKI